MQHAAMFPSLCAATEVASPLPDEPAAQDHASGAARRANARPCIRPVASDEEWGQVWRLRYDAFVAEQGFDPEGADHDRRLLPAAVDATATTLIAIANGAVVATIQLELEHLATSALGRLLGTASWLQRVPPDALCIASKLVVAPSLRGSRLAAAMVTATYAAALRAGRRWSLLGCKPCLRPFYERFGFRVSGGVFHAPHYGDAQRMSLDLLDLAHLEAVRSPFAAILSEHLGQASSLRAG